MNFVQPIKDLEVIEKLKNELMHQSYRNYFFFVLGINSGISCEDILVLKVQDIKDKDFITIFNNRIKSSKEYTLSDGLKFEISQYIKTLDDNEYLFTSHNNSKLGPITRAQVNVFLSKAANKIGISKMSFHVLRKTFGYFHYKEHGDIKYLQDLFGHPSPSYTFEYIGVKPKLALNKI